MKRSKIYKSESVDVITTVEVRIMKRSKTKIASIIFNVLFFIGVVITTFFFATSLSIIMEEANEAGEALGSVIALVLVLIPFFLIAVGATVILGIISLILVIKSLKHFKTKVLFILDIVFLTYSVAIFPLFLLIANNH